MTRKKDPIRQPSFQELVDFVHGDLETKRTKEVTDFLNSEKCDVDTRLDYEYILKLEEGLDSLAWHAADEPVPAHILAKIRAPYHRARKMNEAKQTKPQSGWLQQLPSRLGFSDSSLFNKLQFATQMRGEKTETQEYFIEGIIVELITISHDETTIRLRLFLTYTDETSADLKAKIEQGTLVQLTDQQQNQYHFAFDSNLAVTTDSLPIGVYQIDVLIDPPLQLRDITLATSPKANPDTDT